MLKIAGVKSEKEFYKKFPTEEAFMAKHGKAFKKAQIGSYIGGESDGGFQPISFQDVYDQADYTITGMTDEMRRDEQLRQSQMAAAQKETGSGGNPLSNVASMLQNPEAMQAITGAFGGAKKGKKLSKLQVGSTSGLLSIPNPTLVTQADQDITKQFYDAQVSPDIQEISGSNIGKTIGQYAPAAGKLIQGIQQAKEEKKALQRAQQMQQVSDVVKQAAETRPEETQRRYVRPEDIVNTGEEFFPIYGVGTNVLARNGASVGGGEIMNTYAPNTLYDNLGYEPLNESERYKQFYHGGKMHVAQSGFEAFAQAGGGDITSQLLTGITGENAGGQIGGTIGKTAGTIIGGPVGGMIGQVGGQLIGTLLDKKPQKIKAAKEATQKNIQATALQSGIQGAQQQYTSFMQDGGTTSPYKWMSHTWQPQVITTFGEHKVSDLLRPPKDADMLRAGGHLKEYTPPSARAMSTERPDFQMGGELQTHWGGYAEPMSYNPYLPEGGETVMFKGQSHDESDGKGNTGIGITYGDNPVEVERGEPAMKMRDGSGGDSSLVVFGNLKVPKGMLPGADGKNFKKYVSELSKNEDKTNKMISKAVTSVDELDVITPYDQLAFNTLQAQIDGGNAKLKKIAQDKMDAAALQTAMNDTIEEFGLETTDRGTIKAKKGMLITKAQDGTKKPKSMSALAEVPKGQKETDIAYGKVTLQDIEDMKKNNPWYDWKGFNPKSKADVLKFQQAFNMLSKAIGSPTKLVEDKLLGEQTVSSKVEYDKETPKIVTPVTTTPQTTIPLQTPEEKKFEISEIVQSKRLPWMDVLNQVLPYVRPSDAEKLDANQLAGEMYALATNQLEPVRAQTFQPQLSVPYDISLQDILNENEATYRSQQRMFGYNPALQSQLNAQKYSANQRVLGEQFRMNQALKNQIYKENRDLLNQSQLQNLGILDQQYVRQQEAKSKTKATTQAALNSIAAKYAQNKLENRTLQVYENLYNYRYDPRFRAINMNPLFQANIPNVQDTYTGLPVVKDGKKIDRKKALNSSIVKSMKNL